MYFHHRFHSFHIAVTPIEPTPTSLRPLPSSHPPQKILKHIPDTTLFPLSVFQYVSLKKNSSVLKTYPQHHYHKK